MSDPLTPQDRDAMRRWAVGHASKLGRQLRALLAERDRLEQELDALKVICGRAADKLFEMFGDAPDEWPDTLGVADALRFAATHPAEEPEETPP